MLVPYLSRQGSILSQPLCPRDFAHVFSCLASSLPPSSMLLTATYSLNLKISFPNEASLEYFPLTPLLCILLSSYTVSSVATCKFAIKCVIS